jgi:D-sedoheptulose 7-phosphate isomerase
MVVTDRYENRISQEDGTTQCCEYLSHVQQHKGVVHCIGNGGSAAIAAHLHNDLAKAGGIRSQIYTSSPLLTAYCNDESYAVAYAQQLQLWVEPNDLLIAISSGGASENILRAVAVAQKAEATVITLSGFSPDNPLRQTGDTNFYLPASDYGIVEMGHSILCHFLSDHTTIQCQAKQKKVHA